MSKVFKLIALCTAGIFLFSGTPYAEVRDLFVPITVGATVPVIEGAGALTVESHNVSDNALVLPLALNFDTAGIGLPPAGNPWVLSSQYLVIDYGMTANNYVAWGVRIVTDNEDLEGDANDVIDSIAGSPIAGNADVDGDGDIWGDADDDLSYAGLVVVGEADPARRATWAWQAYIAVQPAVTAPTSAIGADGALVNVGFVGPDRAGPPPVSGGEWNGYWAYIADKNDLDGNGDGVNGFIGDLFRDLDGDGADDDPTYSMVLVSSATRNGTLTPHPDPTVAPRGDDDSEIVVYIAGRFANTDYSDPANPTPIVLPVLSYGASLYVELVHE